VAQTLGFEPTVAETVDTSEVQPLDGLEIDAPLPDKVDLQAGTVVDVEQSSLLGTDASEVSSEVEILRPDILGDTTDLPDDLAMELDDLSSDEGTRLLEQEASELDLIEADGPTADAETELEEAGAGELPEEDGAVAPASEVTFIQVTGTNEPSVGELEDRVLEDPDSPEPHRALGEALLASGEAQRGQEELELALAAYENREDWDRASDLVNELILLDPNGVRYHQKRVELAFRGGDRGRLLEAYVELGDALMRVGALDKALAVYRRVAEHDPANARARAALDSLSPVEEEAPPVVSEAEPDTPDQELDELDQLGAERTGDDAPRERPAPRLSAPMFAPSGDYVDLGAMILEGDRPLDPRLRVADEEPTGDEQRDFQEMLTQFKRGIDENIGAEDSQAHYDLGVAFREMGLLDEAIAEFQKALRAPEGRLRTSEALGTSFYDKGQFAIAEAILKRAVESLGAGDDEQIGLLYWLARSREAQGKIEAALICYERVLAVDIGFQDAGTRMASLTAQLNP
jgi:tetratricopeptide (TPR) repeat protein